jgi:lactate dehydrogenase-like 2-hydroxyacid dehydrogenase
MSAPASKPTLLITRRLPAAVQARASRDYDAQLNQPDDLWALDAAEIARRATASNASAILCAAGDAMNAACIAALPASVKLIATFSVGTDHIDLAAARAKNIPVANTPDVLSFATAEIAFTLMLMAARRAGEGERLLRAGNWGGWAPTQLMGVTLEGKKLGILGMGRIGRELAKMARGFSMEVHYRNRSRLSASEEAGATFHAEDSSFLAGIDVLSMHIPGGAATRHWLNAERLGLLKRGAIVVNTGRGTTVDDAALVAALQSGQVLAAGLDVYDGEPRVFPGYLGLENVALLPHLGSGAVETRDAMGFRALDSVDAVVLRGEVAPFLVA